ncbi:MAG: hypothetical protein D6698_01845 [Gammaproteobacteria bacterium]|nr:MAG: hypothetical protein D6698_01845 [Gammaproteobacteria bacterium]
MRPTRPQMFMEIAQVVAKRATCMRLNVGAVLVQNRRIVSIGYNGAPAGAPHCLGNECPGKYRCHETTHAEVNALIHLSPELTTRDRVVKNLDLYVTDSPCKDCFDMIVTSGLIRRIFFGTPYRITDHLIGHGQNIGIYRVLPAGYIVDWKTKELVDVET